jgi:ATP-binding cassette subfamily C (CFTR/MRP) protein 1
VSASQPTQCYFTNGVQAGGNGNYRLLRDILVAFKWDVLAPVPPRIVLLGFTIAQPLLLNRFILFIQAPTQSVNIGYGLIASFGIAFLGMAVSFQAANSAKILTLVSRYRKPSTFIEITGS